MSAEREPVPASGERGTRGGGEGRILRLGIKPATGNQRGFPKPAVSQARITARGLAGDHNVWRATKKGNDPDYAVMLITVEVLRAVQAEGWPVQPGDIGENVLTEGVPYEAFQPGTRWRLGAAEIQISKPCDPCDNLYALPYVGEAKGPAFLKTLMHRRGWYARVVQEGEVRAGDAVAPAGTDRAT